MRKIITVTTLFIVLAVLCTRLTRAENISVESAYLKNQEETSGFDYRVRNLKNFLDKYNSPLSEYADEFVAYADQNDLDYRLVPAITGVESTFGKHIPYDSYNAYGWANGEYKFSSWEDSIAHVSEVLKSKYIDHGAVSINQIARIYAPPSSTWGGKVSFFVKKIDTLPVNFDII
jgi:hypothetical protein